MFGNKKPDSTGEVISSAMILKRCPFCGDHVKLTYSTFGKDKVFHIYHTGPERCILDDFSFEAPNIKTVEDAYEVWNHRDGRT